MNRDVYFVGDVHGHWDVLMNKIGEYALCDCILIQVGDFGVGFVGKTIDGKDYNYDTEYDNLRTLNSTLAALDIDLLVIRGNHDDPSYFNAPRFMGSNSKTCPFSNIDFLPDYTTLNINGEKYLFVGGATSIDREERIMKDEKYGTVRWWPRESFKYDESKAVECDILVTHTGPTWNGPFNKACFDMSSEAGRALHADCMEERMNIDRLIRKTSPRAHYCGHFHTHSTVWSDHTVSHILDINEFQALRKGELVHSSGDSPEVEAADVAYLNDPSSFAEKLEFVLKQYGLPK